MEHLTHKLKYTMGNIGPNANPQANKRMAKSIGVITILVRTGWCSDQQTVLLTPLSCKRFQENV